MLLPETNHEASSMHPCCLCRLYALIQMGNSPCMVPLLQRMCVGNPNGFSSDHQCFELAAACAQLRRETMKLHVGA